MSGKAAQAIDGKKPGAGLCSSRVAPYCSNTRSPSPSYQAPSLGAVSRPLPLTAGLTLESAQARPRAGMGINAASREGWANEPNWFNSIRLVRYWSGHGPAPACLGTVTSYAGL